jgi:hypothetical protein
MELRASSSTLAALVSGLSPPVPMSFHQAFLHFNRQPCYISPQYSWLLYASILGIHPNLPFMTVGRNITEYALAINATGKAIRIENCK